MFYDPYFAYILCMVLTVFILVSSFMKVRFKTTPRQFFKLLMNPCFYFVNV